MQGPDTDAQDQHLHLFIRLAPHGRSIQKGQSATKWYVRIKSGSPPITDIRLAFPKLAPGGASGHLRLAALHRLANLEPLELRMIQIQWLVVPCPTMGCSERL